MAHNFHFHVWNIQNSYTVVPEHRRVIGSDLSLFWTCANEVYGKALDYILNVKFLVAKKISACALHVRIGMRGLNGIVLVG